jgi:hypothetical protein
MSNEIPPWLQYLQQSAVNAQQKCRAVASSAAKAAALKAGSIAVSTTKSGLRHTAQYAAQRLHNLADSVVEKAGAKDIRLTPADDARTQQLAMAGMLAGKKLETMIQDATDNIATAKNKIHAVYDDLRTRQRYDRLAPGMLKACDELVAHCAESGSLKITMQIPGYELFLIQGNEERLLVSYLCQHDIGGYVRKFSGMVNVRKGAIDTLLQLAPMQEAFVSALDKVACYDEYDVKEEMYTKGDLSYALTVQHQKHGLQPHTAVMLTLNGDNGVPDLLMHLNTELRLNYDHDTEVLQSGGDADENRQE